VERAAPDDEAPRLRIARYLDRPQEQVNPATPGKTWPNISDYWPDAPHRQRDAGWRAFLPDGPEHTLPGGPPARRWRQRPAVLTGLLALAVICGSVLLARPVTDADLKRNRAAPVLEQSEAVIPLLPSPPASTTPGPVVTTTTPVKTSAAHSTAPPAKATPAKGSFELVTGVGDLAVRTADLGGEDFAVSGPADGTFAGGVLRVSATSGGSGPVTVQLSDRRVWQLRVDAGTRSVTLDLGSGTVRGIDLAGGAERIDITLGRLDRTVPIRMAVGVSTWRIRTATKVPVRVVAGKGAGDVVLYGQHSGGVGAGATLRSGDLDDAPGLDIDATGGLGNLEVTTG
jgi:hypothetical protein